MTERFEILCIEYVRCCALLNHLKQEPGKWELKRKLIREKDNLHDKMFEYLKRKQIEDSCRDDVI